MKGQIESLPQDPRTNACVYLNIVQLHSLYNKYSMYTSCLENTDNNYIYRRVQPADWNSRHFVTLFSCLR